MYSENKFSQCFVYIIISGARRDYSHLEINSTTLFFLYQKWILKYIQVSEVMPYVLRIKNNIFQMMAILTYVILKVVDKVDPHAFQCSFVYV